MASKHPELCVDQPQGVLSFLQDYSNIPLLSLEEAVHPLLTIVPDLGQMISAIKRSNYVAKDGLNHNESASISLFSLEWKPRERSFDVILNSTLLVADRRQLQPWFPYLRLLKSALEKLPSESSGRVVHHSIKLNLAAQYPAGRAFVWWSLTRCTASLEGLNKECTLGQTGARTLFIIDCSSAKNIRQHSYDDSEDDVLLPVGCHLQVTSCFNAGNGLHVIHLTDQSSSLPPVAKLPRVSFASRPPPRPVAKLPEVKVSQPTPIKVKNVKVQEAMASLSSDTTVTVLDLSRSQLGDQDVKTLVDVLRQNQTLTTINLQGNRIGDQGAHYLANVLQQNRTLTTVNLRGNQIRSQGTQHLAQALRVNATLTSLNLRSNLIGNAGAHHLANILESNETIVTLDLASNRIDPQGAQHLAQGLARNKTLTTLSLDGNIMGQQGVERLANALQQNRTLTELNLEDNQLSLEGKRRVGRLTKNNVAVKVLL